MSDSPRVEKPGDEISPGTPQSGDNICPNCRGTGQVDNNPCPQCKGTGTVTTLVGDA
jgi:DnaJ-class molecular chaperone